MNLKEIPRYGWVVIRVVYGNPKIEPRIYLNYGSALKARDALRGWHDAYCRRIRLTTHLANGEVILNFEP